VGVSFVVQDANRHEEKDFVRYWAHRADFVRTSEMFVDGAFPGMRVEQKKRGACPALYDSIAVHTDGKVSYCCLDGFGETNVGNVFEQGLEAVWHGEKLNQVREWHETGQWDKVPFCKSCTRWASYEFVETIEDGLLIRRSPEYTYYNRIDRLESWKGSLRGNHKMGAVAESVASAAESETGRPIST
jgi:radical SAM protein with 4Fe4S-binding SPASM domain